MTATPQAKFLKSGAFHRELKLRAERHFEETALTERGRPELALKFAVIVAWWLGSWSFLVFFADHWLAALGGCVSLALAMAGIGFSVQHDGNHGSASERAGINRLFGAMLDAIGGSSYVWRWKHNVLHHSQPNVVGYDADLNVEPWARLAPEQRRRPWHRFQHLYMWALYGMLALKWHFVDDVLDVIRGDVGGRKMPRPRGVDLLQFVGGKLFFYGWALALPSLWHPFSTVVAVYLFTAFILGVMLAVTFQLAHCVDEAEFPARPRSPALGASPAFESDWATHQVQTTVDFAPENRLATWYLGGLNFQVVHHLFPKVSHVHYPALSRIVKDVCEAHGLRYRVHASVGAALASHARWLEKMGRPAPVLEFVGSTSNVAEPIPVLIPITERVG